jgi:hypothetical protein
MSRSPRISLLLVSLLIGSFWAAESGASDLCSDSRVLKAANPGDCSTITMPVQAGDSEQPGTVATVRRGHRWDRDVGIPVFDVYLETPAGELVPLGDFKPIVLPGRADSFLYRSLDVDPARAGGTCCIPHDIFFERAMQKIGDRYCVSYRMKPPFRGSFVDCGGDEKPTGDIGYVDGVVTWADARGRATEASSREPGSPWHPSYDGNIFTGLRRDHDDSLYYVAIQRRRMKDLPERAHVTVLPGGGPVTSVPVEYRYIVYRIDALGGELKALERSSTAPDVNRWRGRQ